MALVTKARVPGTKLEVQARSRTDRPKVCRLFMRNIRTTSVYEMGFTFDDYKADHYVKVAVNYAERMLSGAYESTSYLAQEVGLALESLLNEEE